MKRYILLFALALSISAASAVNTTDGHLTGYIDDSMCAASTTPMCTAANRASCAAKCIKEGAKAVLVSGGKIYKIANQKSVMKFLGKNVTIDFTMNGDTIEVTGVTETKS